MNTISQEIANLAHHLPHHLLLSLATQLERAQNSEWGYIRAMSQQIATPQAHYRTRVEQLLKR